jgi:hypothetical protein
MTTMKLQMTVAALAIVACCTTVEARGGRRGGYTPYYNNYYNYNVMPTTPVVPATTTPSATAATTVAPTSTKSESEIVQVSANKPETPVETANATASSNDSGNNSAANAEVKTTPATDAPKPAADAPKPVVAGSAQWKAEQCARMGAVVHLGGHFGGGSHEGCGFGATADQAIRNSCFWGQLVPIEIGVARGANGYYATIFYR